MISTSEVYTSVGIRICSFCIAPIVIKLVVVQQNRVNLNEIGADYPMCRKMLSPFNKIIDESIIIARFLQIIKEPFNYRHIFSMQY